MTERFRFSRIFLPIWKHMKKIDLKKLDRLLFFTKESLRLWEKNENTLDFNIKYWLKQRTIISIKKGSYILKERLDKEVNKELYLEYLANKIYEPSYLSCEYVMSKYNLLTEAVWNITSITTNKTKIFKSSIGQFSYYSITSRLFTDFEIKPFNSAKIVQAKKTKAVFDYLYLRFLRKTPINLKSIDELRINWENLSKNEFNVILNYGKVSGNKRILNLLYLIKEKYYD